MTADARTYLLRAALILKANAYPLILPAILGVWLYLPAGSDESPPTFFVMSLMILLYLNIHRLGVRLKWIRHHIFWASAVFGLMGGLLAGTVNVMLPALIIFALEMDLKPLVTVQIFNFSFFFGKISQATVLTAHGYLGGAQLLAALPVVGVALLALVIGIRYRDRVKVQVYRKWLKITLGAIASLLIFQYVGII